MAAKGAIAFILDHKADKLEAAQNIDEVIAEGKVRTYDMCKMSGKPDVVQRGAASTFQMTDAILARL